MIPGEETIVPDQIVKSIVPGKVCVLYPRGSQTRLAVLFDQDPPQRVPAAEGTDNGFTQFTITPTGNLVNIPDRPTGQATTILGAGLQPL